eukprot:TRINITY_DN676_c0_g1_i1.p1 TRINITY_DN676_c0_g1~~TRINITY_DN676_c0_g1_i1.p1  ORF type:complete len:635 (+),score=168.76 TRINITY_DN676_c0_g1_i1:57-1961(+)
MLARFRAVAGRRQACRLAQARCSSSDGWSQDGWLHGRRVFSKPGVGRYLEVSNLCHYYPVGEGDVVGQEAVWGYQLGIGVASAPDSQWRLTEAGVESTVTGERFVRGVPDHEGRVYYQSQRTGEVMWEPKTEASPPAAAPAAAAPAASPAAANATEPAASDPHWPPPGLTAETARLVNLTLRAARSGDWDEVKLHKSQLRIREIHVNENRQAFTYTNTRTKQTGSMHDATPPEARVPPYREVVIAREPGEKLGFRLSSGNVVLHVTEGGLAQKAGLEPDMRIAAVNGRAVNTPTELHRAARADRQNVHIVLAERCEVTAFNEPGGGKASFGFVQFKDSMYPDVVFVPGPMLGHHRKGAHLWCTVERTDDGRYRIDHIMSEAKDDIQVGEEVIITRDTDFLRFRLERLGGAYGPAHSTFCGTAGKITGSRAYRDSVIYQVETDEGVVSVPKECVERKPPELRVDKADGKEYPLASFIGLYGKEDGQRRWDESKPLSKDVFSVQLKGGKKEHAMSEGGAKVTPPSAPPPSAPPPTAESQAAPEPEVMAAPEPASPPPGSPAPEPVEPPPDSQSPKAAAKPSKPRAKKSSAADAELLKNIDGMSHRDLQVELKGRNLLAAGTRAVLVDRLRSALASS